MPFDTGTSWSGWLTGPVDLGDYRQDYETAGLDIGDVDPDPFAQFERWFREAEQAEVYEPNAMTVSSVTSDGAPHARVVLLKTFDTRGFVFYTNYRSDKGRQIDANPATALTFAWVELHRQIRIVGQGSHVSAEESDDYYNSRPRGSRIGAWASPQSEVIADRSVLDERWREIDERFADQDIPRPEHWGGIRVVPSAIEFWQGRQNRMHDRLRYRRTGTSDGSGQGSDSAGWAIERLAP